jgi:hypothetical protein
MTNENPAAAARIIGPEETAVLKRHASELIDLRVAQRNRMNKELLDLQRRQQAEARAAAAKDQGGAKRKK